MAVYQLIRKIFVICCPVNLWKLQDSPAVQSSGDGLARIFSPRVLTESSVVQELSYEYWGKTSGPAEYPLPVSGHFCLFTDIVSQSWPQSYTKPMIYLV